MRGAALCPVGGGGGCQAAEAAAGLVGGEHQRLGATALCGGAVSARMVEPDGITWQGGGGVASKHTLKSVYSIEIVYI